MRKVVVIHSDIHSMADRLDSMGHRCVGRAALDQTGDKVYQDKVHSFGVQMCSFRLQCGRTQRPLVYRLGLKRGVCDVLTLVPTRLGKVFVVQYEFWLRGSACSGRCKGELDSAGTNSHLLTRCS